jgi:anti-anti-sigma factor
MLKINTEFRKGVLFVRLSGQINNVKDLEAINTIIEDIGIRYIVLNINNLRYVDVNSVNHIMDYNKQMLKNKGRLLICDTNQRRKKIFNNIIPNITCEIDAFSLM